ncbi:MAG: thioredoxin [Gammaproteobacteria bacterium]|nr:MAG: thioredoxin [Gammaproteobacteria bacterium]
MKKLSLGPCLGVFITLIMLMSGLSALAAEVQSALSPLPGLSADQAARLISRYGKHSQEQADDSFHTLHRNADGSAKYVNALIAQDSPYLQQHSHNPVNWYAWGEDAFTRARLENKPIFLSIGYSTCHWCHVMARESFDNEGIAYLLNQHFISIKVDREQHPDVDEIYMTGVQLIRGQGGWPMSNFLTPEGKPFYAATYFPIDEFSGLLQKVHKVWVAQESRVRSDADRLSEQIKTILSAGVDAGVAGGKGAEVASARFTSQLVDRGVSIALQHYQTEAGGFSSAPKFPNESLLLFLLDQIKRQDRPALLAAVQHTLHRMAQGGIYDQVGGGFHRYSVDDQWLVPHFEKMLYNQAMLGRVYSDAYQVTGQQYFAQISRETLDYVLRDMRDDAGCFYSATDADSGDEEGRFFVWTPQQLTQSLGAADADWLMALYGVSEQGNFEHANILYLPHSYAEVARRQKVSVDAVYQRLSKLKETLYQQRQQRLHPLLDKKIITAWNGMMVTTLARGSNVLSEQSYIQAALRCGEYLYQHHWDQSAGQLWRIGWQGRVSIPAVHEDYAYLVEAMLALYDATGDKLWLERSKILTEQMIVDFWDAKRGGFFVVGNASIDTKGDSSSGMPDKATDTTVIPSIVRAKSTSDASIPSSNSVALHILQQLWERTGEIRYRQYFKQSLSAMGGSLKRNPLGTAYGLVAANNFYEGSTGTVVYFAEGNIVARLRAGDEKDRFNLELNIAPPWHINSDRVLQDQLIPTQVSVSGGTWWVDSVVYPQAKEVVMDFQSQPLRLLDGEISIEGRAINSQINTYPLRLQLILQACEHDRCLLPNTRTLLGARP